MATKVFRTRYGAVRFKTGGSSKSKKRSNPKGKRKGRGKKKVRRKARSKARKAAKNPRTKVKNLSKKVGRWRVECKGRTVYAAGAKHAYKNGPAACAAYKRMTSVRSVENFVSRYGKKATKKAVTGRGKKKATKKRKNPCGSGYKIKKSRRRNVPISRPDAAVIRRILAQHGY